MTTRQESLAELTAPASLCGRYPAVVGERMFVERELRAFLEPRLARSEIPRYFRIKPDALPRMASGKTLERQLREEAIAYLDAAVPAPVS